MQPISRAVNPPLFASLAPAFGPGLLLSLCSQCDAARRCRELGIRTPHCCILRSCPLEPGCSGTAACSSAGLALRAYTEYHGSTPDEVSAYTERICSTPAERICSGCVYPCRALVLPLPKCRRLAIYERAAVPVVLRHSLRWLTAMQHIYAPEENSEICLVSSVQR